ncbi:MAG: signal peptidase II [Shinella sp.]|nr:MAG: signal peptidase II [Shinella sp.]
MQSLLKLRAPIVVAVSAVAIDQIVKLLMLRLVMSPPQTIEVTPFFNLVLVFNYGVSFGMFADYVSQAPQIFAALKLMLVIGIMIWATRVPRYHERLALGSIAGGALGNIVDRFFNGAVTDYLDFHIAGFHWPAFNLADVFIVLGAFSIIVGSFFAAESKPHPLNVEKL